MAAPRFEDIVENFELFDDWEDRYRYVIDLGKEMPELPVSHRIDANKVDGCASQVWLVPSVETGDGEPRLVFQGDSDAMIVRGLIALLIARYSGQPVSEIRDSDAQAEFARLGLDEALSAQRSNGLRAMVTRLKDLAAHAAPA